MTESIHRPNRGPARAGRAGFTLLELVAVIGIIAIMSVVVVGGFGGILKALARETGIDAVRRAVNLARQQACVDGQVTYVWVTGLNSFVIVRRGGVVADAGQNSQGSRDYWYGKDNDRKVEDAGDGNAKWVYDEYTDLTDYKIDFPDVPASDVRAMLAAMRGVLVFDMEEGVIANMIVPPQRDSGVDAWVFGVCKTNISNRAFEPGAKYGWVTLPEQSLPKGYAFANTSDSDGEYDPSKAPRVYFNPDGTTGGGEFVVFETDTGKGQKLGVKKDGSLDGPSEVEVSE